MQTTYKDSALAAGQPYKIQQTAITDRLNTKTETQIEELHEIFADINGVIAHLSNILEPITLSLPTESSVGPLAAKPVTTSIYDKLDALKDRGFSTLDRLNDLRRSIDL